MNPFSNPTASGVATAPRAIVVINGVSVRWIEIEITTTTFYIADNYRVEIPLSDQPDSIDINELFSVQKMEIRIYIGFPLDPDQYTTTELDLLMIGDVDRLTVDPLTKMATFMGRDLTSRLIDTKTYAKYSNKTASDIAIILANKHDLTPIVTPTSEKVGIFYAYQNTLLSRETTEWDLICFLAQQQDFVVYVESGNLIFKPRPTKSSDPYIIDYTDTSFFNESPVFYGTSLTFERSLTLAKDVIVKVRIPYSPQTGTASTVRVSSKHAHARDPETQTYVYTFPGLSKDQAIARANQIIRDITLHEIKVNISMPADNELRKDSLIQIIGPDHALNQQYFTDEVVRKFNMDEGYSMHISAKNHSVDSQVSL